MGRQGPPCRPYADGRLDHGDRPRNIMDIATESVKVEAMEPKTTPLERNAAPSNTSRPLHNPRTRGQH
eukprot:6295240-Lingulodinium_polyedra.AAC.1